MLNRYGPVGSTGEFHSIRTGMGVVRIDRPCGCGPWASGPISALEAVCPNTCSGPASSDVQWSLEQSGYESIFPGHEYYPSPVGRFPGQRIVSGLGAILLGPYCEIASSPCWLLFELLAYQAGTGLWLAAYYYREAQLLSPS